MAAGEVPPGEPAAPRGPLPDWRQGDCVVGPQWLAYRVDGDPDLLEDEVPGFVVISQSCDIERSVDDCRFVEVAPLVAMDPDFVHRVKQELHVRHAFVPGVAARGLVADLSRSMSVDKTVVVGWVRTPGCSSDEERIAFARALARKHSRFAFPDDFNRLVRRLVDRIEEKHDRPQSLEGRALRALRWILVRAAPRWDAEEVELTFFFVVRDGDTTFEGQAWESLRDKWIALVPATGRYRTVRGDVGTMEYFTMRNFVESPTLDLDRLSGTP